MLEILKDRCDSYGGLMLQTFKGRCLYKYKLKMLQIMKDRCYRCYKYERIDATDIEG
jgi:hypothetical protein